MAFESGTVEIGTGDTDVYEMPALNDGAVVIGLSNKSGSAATYTFKYYKQSTATTETFANGVPYDAHKVDKFPFPIAMQAGDKIIMSASAGSAMVAQLTITRGSAAALVSIVNPRGPWNSIASYVKNDVASRFGISFLAINPNTDSEPQPDDSNPDWMVMASAVGAIASSIYAAGMKAAPDDADRFGFLDSVSSFNLVQFTWANLKAALKTTASLFWSGTDDATFLTPKAVKDASAFIPISSASMIEIDGEEGINFIVDPLNHNTTIAEPENLLPGTVYSLYLVQGSTGGTIAVDANFVVLPTPTASVGAGKTDILSFVLRPSDGKLIARFSRGS